MSLVGSYDNSSIDIEGSEESLRELSNAIQNLSSIKILPLANPRPQDPYPGHARSLRLGLSDDFVCITRAEDEIFICGAPDKLAILAQNILALADQKREQPNGRLRLHSHIEYHPDHFFLKAGSIPLVVTKIVGSHLSESVIEAGRFNLAV